MDCSKRAMVSALTRPPAGIPPGTARVTFALTTSGCHASPPMSDSAPAKWLSGDAYACFPGASDGWLVADSLHSPGTEAVFASTDAGARWHQVLAPAMLRSGRVNAQRYVWLSGRRGSQA
jgi:hypothetical protein